MNAKDTISLIINWTQLAREWNNGRDRDLISTDFDQALIDVESAINVVNGLGDGTSLSISISRSDIEKLHIHRRLMLSFCNSIHYEIIELIDTPFSQKLSDSLEIIYAFNPKNISISKSGFMGINYSQKLSSFMDDVIIDEALRDDFNEKIKELNKDEINDKLKDDITEIDFWEKEFQKADACRDAADRIFTSSVKANWDNMTSAQREALLLQYANEVNVIIGEGKAIVNHYEIKYITSMGLHHSSTNTVDLNEEFINIGDTTISNYDMEKAIETITHETRHQYQSECKNEGWFFGLIDNQMKKHNISHSTLSQWLQPYISPSPDYMKYWNQSVETDARAFAALSRMN